MERSSGILLPIFSLPSNYGIGTFGKEAYNFVDFLKKANQKYWQILPLGPTAYGDSPYSTYSIYAGNPYFIDLDLLIKDGLLTRNDVKKLKTGNKTKVLYDKLSKTRYTVLYKAYEKGYSRYKVSFDKFCKDNKSWLDDYALYISLRKYFGDKSWTEWKDKKIKIRDKQAIKKYKFLLEDEIEFQKFIQYLFYKQFNKLKKYMNRKGIKLIGDIPIYVPLDSADVWANPKCFMLTSAFVPKLVSGCPPDNHNSNGQLWGNPIYNYSYMKKDGYKWWLNRIKGASNLYDVIRIDHFRGFESFWAIPYGKNNPKKGKWMKGPNMDLLGLFKNKFKNVKFIAEDLGYITDEVKKMVKEFGYPGMKVMQYGFSTEELEYVPYNYEENTVCYVGTHDNSTAMGFFEYGKKSHIRRCKEYFNIKNSDRFNEILIKGGMESKSVLFIAQMQDYLGLDNTARINCPGIVGGNWLWRMKKGAYDNKLANKINKLTILYGRDEKTVARRKKKSYK